MGSPKNEGLPRTVEHVASSEVAEKNKCSHNAAPSDAHVLSASGAVEAASDQLATGANGGTRILNG